MMILIISTCLIIAVLMYYLKNHVKNYGIFVTLGMRKQTLYAFMAVELISCMLISLFLGVLFGRIVSFMCCRGITGIAGIKLALGKITYKTYLLTAISTMVMFLLSVLFTHEVYIDTGASVSGKKEIEREKMPGQFARLGLIVGVIIITFSVIRYSSYTNFEGTQNLVLFLAGIYLVLRNGLVEILNQRKQKIGKYFGTLLKNNQFYYRYKSTVRYMFLFTIVNFCVLFVFAKGMLSALIAEQTDKQFPYDFVCMAIEEDEDIFEKIRDKYDVKMYQFPMVRVANADNSREPDNSVAPIFPQGQEIGISESTYQELCRLQGWEVEEKELAADGSDVKIVFQQDESVEAHPIDYFVGTKKPFLHIGQPVQYYEFQYRKQIFVPRKVRGIKTGALIGNLRQGKHENIVVFSDEYFEK